MLRRGRIRGDGADLILALRGSGPDPAFLCGTMTARKTVYVYNINDIKNELKEIASASRALASAADKLLKKEIEEIARHMNKYVYIAVRHNAKSEVKNALLELAEKAESLADYEKLRQIIENVRKDAEKYYYKQHYLVSEPILSYEKWGDYRRGTFKVLCGIIARGYVKNRKHIIEISVGCAAD